MNKHVAVPSSQVKFPWRSAVRTALQVGPAAFSAALLLPPIIEVIVSGYGDALPKGLQAFLLGFAGFITLTATIIARIMALPGVDNFIREHKLTQWFAPSKPVDPPPAVVDVDPGL